MIKSRNYSRRPTIALHKARKSARRKSGTRFFVKLIILFTLLGGVLWGGFVGGSKLYQRLSQIRVEGWRVKTMEVVGLEGDLLRQVTALAAPYQHQAFPIKQAVALREKILQQYPMLTNVSVKRGLWSGKLTISAQHRVPLAQFIRPDGKTQYIDRDSTIYADSHPSVTDVPRVELAGDVPDKLNAEYIDVVESTLKLQQELKFTTLQLNLTNQTVRMSLPDGTEVDFGPASRLKQKVTRAAQVLAVARKKYTGPFVVNFQFFENGKIFLTQKSL